jgi:hypothetical protein
LTAWVRVALELVLVEARHLAGRLQIDASQGGRAVDVAQRHARRGRDAVGRVAGLTEDVRERHAEAGCVRRRDQLLGVRACALLEA